jgi:hypothetical protein
MKVIIVKMQQKAARRHLKFLRKNLTKEQPFLAWQLVARLKRLIRNYAIATSIFRTAFQ